MDKRASEDGPAASPSVDIYKIYVKTAEGNIERRQKVNQFYFSVVVAIFVAFGYLADGRAKPPEGGLPFLQQVPFAVPLLLLLLLLLIVCFAWRQQIRRSRAVSTAKFNVIEKLEAELYPQPFILEKQEMSKLQRVASGSKIEETIPSLFILIAIVGLLGSFVLIYLKWNAQL